MAERITVKTLRAVCDTLNRRQGFPEGTPVWRREGERNVATVGMFYIDGAYGGWSLYRVMNEGGGVTDPFRSGHMPARELYGLMWAYLTAQADADENKTDAALRASIRDAKKRKKGGDQ